MTDSTVLQIAKLVNTHSQFIEVEILPVQQQKNTTDCAVFAIAFAIEICIGTDLTTIAFEQNKMRNHLLDCLLNHKITCFPKTKKVVSRAIHRIHKIKVYCICRMPDFYDSDMVECEMCKEWFHYKCVTVKHFNDWKCVQCCNS